MSRSRHIDSDQTLLWTLKKLKIDAFLCQAPVVAARSAIRGWPNRTVEDRLRAMLESGMTDMPIIAAEGSRTEVQSAAPSDSRDLRRAA